MFTVQGAVRFVFTVLVIGAIWWLLHFLIGYIVGQFPGMAPFGKIADIGLVVIGVLILIGYLLDVLGYPIIKFRGPPNAP